MNYDPNIRDATQIVRVTLQQWEYKGYLDVECGGNCKGKSILDFASELYEENIINNNCRFSISEDDEEYFNCILTNGDEDMAVEDEVGSIESYIVGLEIIDFKSK